MKKEVDTLDKQFRNDDAKRKMDLSLLNSSLYAKKTLNVTDVLKVQERLANEEKLQLRVQSYNKWLEKQNKEERIFKNMGEVRRECSPFFPKSFLED